MNDTPTTEQQGSTDNRHIGAAKRGRLIAESDDQR
jgi:hypothetical protein